MKKTSGPLPPIRLYSQLLSRSRERHSTTSRVSLYTSFVLWLLPVCFTTEQSTFEYVEYVLIYLHLFSLMSICQIKADFDVSETFSFQSLFHNNNGKYNYEQSYKHLLTSSSNKTIGILKKLSFNPLTPGSDSHVSSHYNILTLSSKQVM